MARPAHQLRQGSIVWVTVPVQRGTPKRRPVVVISPTENATGAMDRPIAALAVTTTVTDPPPPNCVPLPYEPRGHPATGLRKRCAVVCDWVVPLRPSEIESIDGYVPTKILARILRLHETMNKR